MTANQFVKLIEASRGYLDLGVCAPFRAGDPFRLYLRKGSDSYLAGVDGRGELTGREATHRKVLLAEAADLESIRRERHLLPLPPRPLEAGRERSRRVMLGLVPSQTLIDRIYAEASAATGKTIAELQAMAGQVFASMLFHAMRNNGRLIWTEAQFSDGKLLVEVDTLPRLRLTTKGGRS